MGIVGTGKGKQSRWSGCRWAVLGSGSKANAYIFQSGSFSFLVDNGYSLKELTRRAAEAGFVLSALDFVFLTHTHQDHFRGVETLCRRLDVPLVVPKGMPLDPLWRQGPPREILHVEPSREYAYGPLTFTAYPTSHDAPASVGYAFSLRGIQTAIMTDTGTVTPMMEKLAPRCRLLFMESNYSERMLEDGNYPEFLKKRISSSRGHLSNRRAAEFVSGFTERGGSRLEELYLTHLSQENNTLETVQETLKEHLTWQGPVTICPRNTLCTPKEADFVPG